jgi:hypothetical protein
MTAIVDLITRLRHGDPETIALGIGVFLAIAVCILIDKIISGDTATSFRRQDDDR